MGWAGSEASACALGGAAAAWAARSSCTPSASSTRAGSGVDAENTTGAVGLYERAGMRVAWQADIYERKLAPVP